MAKATKATKASDHEYRIGLGDRVPEFKTPADDGRLVSRKDLKGRGFVLYFYPRDNTPGCTLEGQDFKKLFPKFRALNFEILGVSKDSIRSHEKFKEKCGFPFPLLADEEEELCRALDVIQMKSLYGRKFEGIERSTFLVDEKGVIRAVWRKVKVPGHAAEVLKTAKALSEERA